MHLLVLSAFRRCWAGPALSQCTFWCSVLSDNIRRYIPDTPYQAVSMHLLVLSAFRLEQTGKKAAGAHRVSMHLLVLSAFRLVVDRPRLFVLRSQCTFWCSVLSDINLTPHELNVVSLNAPSGAQCFPTDNAGD